MKKLLKYLKNYKKECILAPLFKGLEASFELFVPIVISMMIDTGIYGSDRAVIYKCGGILLLLSFLGYGCAILAQYFSAKAAMGFGTLLRHDLFSHLLNFSFSDIDNMGTSTMITRITSDVNQVQTGVNMVLRLFLRSPFIVFGAVILAFTIDPKSALIFVILVVILFAVSFYIIVKNIDYLTIVQQSLEKVTGKIRENLRGVRVVRAFSRQEKEKEYFNDVNKTLMNDSISAGKISGLLNPITYVIINIFIVVLIKVTNVRVSQGDLTSGQVVALYNYMSQILVELVKFANFIITVNKAVSSARRVNSAFEFGNGSECVLYDSNSGLYDNEFEVVFDDVSIKYHENADEALSNINMKVKKGETIGIIGATGSGKSSIAHLIAGHYAPSNGKVFVNSKSKDKIGYVMQKSVLLSGTIADNLRLGNPEADDEMLNIALKNACCDDVVNDHGGLYSNVNEGGSNFSGGQKQRICIARALSMNPKILILDDSSSALDYATERKLRENLLSLSNDLTIFIISQRVVSVMNCDSILVLEDGKCVGMGTHKELLENCSVYKEIYSSQS